MILLFKFDQLDKTLEGFPLLPRDLVEDRFLFMGAFYLATVIWSVVGLFGVTSLCLFLYYCFLWIFSRNTDSHDPRIKDSCSRCRYCYLMSAVFPLTVLMLVYQLIVCWDVTLLYSCDYSFSKYDPVWDKIQYTFECCGQYNYTDWGGNIPASCCKDPCHGCTASNAFKKGCHPFIKDLFVDALKSRTIPLQIFHLASIALVILLFRHMLRFVFPKCFSGRHDHRENELREDDIEAVSVEDHVENEYELEDEIEDEDHESDEQLLEDFVQNIDEDQDTELLLDA